MMKVQEALKIMLNAVKPMPAETVPVMEARKRVIFHDIVSGIEIPSFDNSAMDGYALISSDTAGAAENKPARLRITGEVQAGVFAGIPRLMPGNAVRIMTGAVMPEGADTVVPVEETTEDNGFVFMSREITKNENIRPAGEDISTGQTVLKKGCILKSADIGILASLNIGKVEVYKRPRIGIISTGDEIVDIGEELKLGQVRNSNAYTIMSLARQYNTVPEYMGIAKDTVEDTKEKFLKGMADNNVLITTGGVSMGKYDFVKDVMKDIGIDIRIETISMKPGKPLVFGVKGDRLFMGLPGNPVSSMISFIQFVRPVILKMMGAEKIEKPMVEAVLMNDIRKKTGRMHFIRGYFQIKGGKFHVASTGPQGSGILRSMSEANCLIILPEDMGSADRGETVTIQLIDHEEI